MIPLRGLVLDVDDTLYLERDYVRSGFSKVDQWLSDEHGLRGVGDEAWRLFEQGRRRTTLGDALQSRTGGQELLADCIEIYRTHRPDIELSSDAAALLDSCVRKVPLAVVTDGPAVSQRAKCKALGLERWIERFVVTDELGTCKPDPTVFEAAIAGWSGATATLAYVADNPAKDFLAPLEMGWQAFRVRRPGSLHYSAETPNGVVEVTDLASLLTNLKGSGA